MFYAKIKVVSEGIYAININILAILKLLEIIVQNLTFLGYQMSLNDDD